MARLVQRQETSTGPGGRIAERALSQVLPFLLPICKIGCTDEPSKQTATASTTIGLRTFRELVRVLILGFGFELS